MPTPAESLIDLETRFWQSMVDQDAPTAMALLHEPALMVSSHGTIRFDRDGYRKMADQGSMIVTSFELSDVDVLFANESTAILTYRVKQAVAPRAGGEVSVQHMNDSSTWIRNGTQWQCVMHTETAAQASGASHGG
jgi:hypothetical protein